jgi:hypothetical protein
MDILPFPVVVSNFDRDRPTKIFLRKGTFGAVPNAGTYDKMRFLSRINCRILMNGFFNKKEHKMALFSTKKEAHAKASKV